MKLEICPSDCYSGGVFKALIRWVGGSSRQEAPDLLAARIVGVVRIGGNEVKFLESVPVQLVVCEGSDVVYRCVMPRGGLPSMRLRSLEVVYKMVVEMYYGKVRETESKVFEVHPVGFEPLKKMESVIIEADMIRIGDRDDTAFGEIVGRLRSGVGHVSGTLEEMVEQKMCLLEGFSGFMNRVVERYREEGKGDIYFYVSMGSPVIEDDRNRLVARDGEEEVARIEYGGHLIRNDRMVIRYKRNTKLTKILLRVAEYIDGEVCSEDERVLKEFRSDMCVRKTVLLAIDHECFTLDCGLFSVSFSYKVMLDGLVFVLPIRKVSPRARVSME